MNKDKVKQLNNLVKEVFNGVTADEVLEFTYEKDQATGKVRVTGITLGAKPLPAADILQLKGEAKTINESMLWKAVVKRVQALAQIKAVNQAQNFEEVIFAKAMILCLEELTKAINLVAVTEIESKKS